MNPFIPREKANTIIIDGRLDNERLAYLDRLDLRIIKTVKCKSVQDPISYHPDVVIHPVNHKSMVVAPEVFDYYSDIFKKDKIKLIKGESNLGYNYPEDIKYNVGRIGNYVIHNTKFMDEKLRFYLEKEGLNFIDVKQGYSKCSIGLIGENKAITSDEGIYQKLREKNIDILLVKNGYIELKGYAYGFIGGSMGNLDKDKVLISGSLEEHVDGTRIKSYIEKEGKEVIELSQETIVDLGSMMCLHI